MRPRKPPPEKTLIRAVEARAAGYSWETVAKLVQRSAQTVRQWPRRFPTEWDAALQVAQQQAVVQAGNEAVGVLRRLMSSKDERISHLAAWRLIYQRVEMARLAVKIAAQVPFLPTPAASRVEPLADGLTNEQRALAIVNVVESLTGTQIPVQQLLARYGP
jgi:hypothetical protein